jgi:hypothetical protein
MTNIVDLALEKIIEQFKEKDNLINFLSAILKPASDLEVDLNNLLTKRWIDTAEGVQLDGLGDIVGEPRRGRLDNEYRAAIKFRIFINTSKADPETIIRASRELGGGDFNRYWENYQAGFQLFSNGPNVLDVSGIGIENFLLITDDLGFFVFDDGAQFLLQTSFETPQPLVNFLVNIAPAGVNEIALNFSLGILPMFGFSTDPYSEAFISGDEEFYPTDDLVALIILLSQNPATLDGFIGFSEMVFQKLVNENDVDFLILPDNLEPPTILLVLDQNQTPVGGGKLIEGVKA